MKKILFSLSLCFLLLLSVNFIKIKADSIILDSGENLIITDVKAQFLDKESKEFKQIPDGTGFFKEPVGGYITYIQDNISYDVVRANRFLPSEINKPSENLLPSMYDNIYVYDGYWSYIEKDKPKIYTTLLSLDNESNIFNHGGDLTLVSEKYFLDDTWGFFIDIDTNNYIYRFYKTYEFNNSYLVDSIECYTAVIPKTSVFLPDNIKYSNPSNYYNANLITFYSTINGKWVDYSYIKNIDYSLNHNVVGDSFIDYNIYSEFNLYPITTYFNIIDINSNILKVDFISQVKIKYYYREILFKPGPLKSFTETYYPESDTIGNTGVNWYDKMIYNRQWDRIVDADLENINYFTYEDNSYRFKIHSGDIFLNKNFNLEYIEILDFTFNYNGLYYTTSNINDNITIHNDFNFFIIFLKIVKLLIFSILFFTTLFLIIKFIRYIYKNKKNKK